MLGSQHRGKFDSESESKEVTYLKQWKKPNNYLSLYLIIWPVQLFVSHMLGCRVSLLLLLFLLNGSTHCMKTTNQVSQQPCWCFSWFKLSFVFLHQCLSFTFGITNRLLPSHFHYWKIKRPVCARELMYPGFWESLCHKALKKSQRVNLINLVFLNVKM